MAEVQVKISAIDEASAVFKKVSGNVAGMGKKMGKAGKAMSLYVTAPLALIGGLMVRTSMQFEEGRATIARATGKTGEELKKLEKIMKRVNVRVVADIGTVAGVIGELDTRLDLTGEQTEEFSKKILKMSHMLGTDAVEATRLITRTMHDWGIPAEEMGKLMDKQFTMAKKTGVSITALNANMVTYGVQLRAVGFEQEEALALLAKWEKEGVATEKMLGGLSMALGRLAKEGINPVDVGFEKLIESIMTAEDETAAMKIAIDKLGMRAGPDFALAVREGRFELGKYTDALINTEGAIINTEMYSRTLGNEIKMMMDEVRTLAAAFGNILKPILRDHIIPAIKNVTKWFKGLTEGQKRNILIIGAIAAAIGPLLLAFSYVIKVVGVMKKAYIGLKLTMLAFKKMTVALIAKKMILFAKILAVIAVIALLVKAVLWIRENWELLGKAVKIVWEDIKRYFEKAIDWIKKEWQMLGDAIYKVWEVIKETFDKAISWIKGVWDSLFEKTYFVLETIKTAAKNAINWIRDVWNRVLTTIRDFFKEKIDAIIAFFAPLIKKIEWVLEKIGKVVDKAKGIGGAVGRVGEDVVERVRGAGRVVGEFREDVIGVGAGILERARGIIAPARELEPARVTNIYIQGGNYLDREAGKMFAEILANEYNLRI